MIQYNYLPLQKVIILQNYTILIMKIEMLNKNTLSVSSVDEVLNQSIFLMKLRIQLPNKATLSALLIDKAPN